MIMMMTSKYFQWSIIYPVIDITCKPTTPDVVDPYEQRELDTQKRMKEIRASFPSPPPENILTQNFLSVFSLSPANGQTLSL